MTAATTQRRTRFAVARVLALCIGLLLGPGRGGAQSEPPSPDALSTVVARVNADRKALGAPPLRINSQITQAAEAGAATVATQFAARGILAATGVADLDRRLLAVGFKRVAAAELVAAGQDNPSTVAAFWLLDPESRAILLSPRYTDVGVGFRRDRVRLGQPDAPTEFWTLVVAAEMPSLPALDVVRADMVSEITRYRRGRGLGPVSGDPRLDRVALRHADDLATRGAISHEGSNGSRLQDRLRDGGYAYRTAVENISVDSQNAAATLSLWTQSPSHDANLRDPDVDSVGLGVVDWAGSPDRPPQRYWVLVLGREAPLLSDVAAVRAEMLAAINGLRGRRSLTPLRDDADIARVAQTRADDLVKRNTLVDSASDASGVGERLLAGRVAYAEARESVAGDTWTASETVELWARSPDHAGTLLAPFVSRAGIGVAERVSTAGSTRHRVWVLIVVRPP